MYKFWLHRLFFALFDNSCSIDNYCSEKLRWMKESCVLDGRLRNLTGNICFERFRIQIFTRAYSIKKSLLFIIQMSEFLNESKKEWLRPYTTLVYCLKNSTLWIHLTLFSFSTNEIDLFSSQLGNFWRQFKEWIRGVVTIKYVFLADSIEFYRSALLFPDWML